MRARYRVLSAFLTVVMAFLALGCGYVEHNSLVKADASDLLSSKDRRPFEQVYEEYLLMMEQSPQMLISCPFCGGSGRSDTECKSCNGSGYKTDPNITMFAAFFPCRECAGAGYPKCSECFLGSYMDPDYQLKREEWDKQRRALLNEMGYSDAEIDAMDRARAKAYLQAHEQMPSEFEGVFQPSDLADAPSGCNACSGIGTCPTCYGDGLMENPYLGGKLQDCANCRSNKGKCWNCNGTGKK